MALRVDADGYILDPNGNRATNVDQSQHDKFKSLIDAEWAQGHPGQSGPPSSQTIMLVQEGDCQWTIAEGAGADPSTTAYSTNGQFQQGGRNPDLIYPGEFVFVSRTTQFAHTTRTYGNQTVDVDNADIFANQVKYDTANGDKNVQSEVDQYLSSIPSGGNTMQNLLEGPDWTGNGADGRKTIITEYLKGFPDAKDAKPGQIDKQTAARQLKADLGLGYWGEPGSDGKETFTNYDKDYFKKQGLSDAAIQDRLNLIQQIDGAAGIQ